MIKKSMLLVAGVTVAITMGAAVAHESSSPAVNARQHVMQLYAFNLGALGAMAKGDVEYDAAAASVAASNLAMLSSMDQSAMWPAGSDNSMESTSRALPDIWQNFPDVGAKSMAMVQAAAAMQEAAGQDLASLRAAMGPLGGACSACHKAYRAPAE